MSKFYADRFYKDASGEYYTGEYLKNHYGYDHKTALENDFEYLDLEKLGWDAYHGELEGEWIRCNYSQIFFPDSNMILCNSIPEAHPEICESLVNGTDYNDETEEFAEIFQWYIIDHTTAERLIEHTDEIIYYIDALDLYVLGVTHCGTGWDYVGMDFRY